MPSEDSGSVPEVASPVLPVVSESAQPTEKFAAPAQTEALLSATEARPRGYPSLYDSTPTTIIAILLGIVIVGGIQVFVQRLFAQARTEHEVLTRFVVTLVALVVGAYMTDLLIAGPDTSLLSDNEHTIILGFIKDICLMVFAFYFGTKASSSPSER
jgi:hypothetical protein